MKTRIRRRDGIIQGYHVVRVQKKGRTHVTRSGKEVIAIAAWLATLLRPYTRRLTIAGSIRRRRPNPVDIDIVLIAKANKKPDIFKVIKRTAKQIESEGQQKISFRLRGVQADIMFATPKDWGAQLLRWTGPAGHNIGLSRIAKRQGMKLSQYGLFKNGRRIAGRTEREIYKALGRPRFKQAWERD